MVKIVTGYMTAGGKLFTSEDRALEYEKSENRQAFTKELLCMSGFTHSSGHEIYADFWGEIVFNNAERVVELLKRYGAL